MISDVFTGPHKLLGYPVQASAAKLLLASLQEDQETSV